MTHTPLQPSSVLSPLLKDAERLIDPTQFGPINLVVIQPTSFCNLDCDYCYLPDRQLKNQLSLELIEPIFERIFTSPFFQKDFTVCWHAGEPLTVPIAFYEAAFERIARVEQRLKPDPCQIIQSFQTNATLINPAWCDFFKRHQVQVGVSIDGPAFINDRHRRTRTGLGTHQGTLRGLQCLKDHDVDFNIIAVVTEDSLDYADEIFNFFVEHDILDVGFNMEETEGVNTVSSLSRQDTTQRYRAFMERMWTLAQGNPDFRIREFEFICGLICADQRLCQTDMNAPFVIVNFDHQGNFSTFDPELLSIKTAQYGDFILGNVLTDTLESVCDSPKFKAIYRDIAAGVDACQAQCDYFGTCGGGACSNKYWENGSFASTETQACRYRTQVVTDLVLDSLEEALGITDHP
jgi:uncharacterized protein